MQSDRIPGSKAGSEPETFDFLQKIVIIGDSGVGKSNILLRYAQDCFMENHTATIGLNYVYRIETIDQIKLKLQIWDTAGQDKFRTITKNYYRNSQGVLVVFALDCRDSFQAVEKWMDDLAEATNEKICILLLGNKNDLPEAHVVSPEEAQQLAKTYGVDYLECSAKTGENIAEAFRRLGKAMKTTFIDNADDPKEPGKEDKLKIHRQPWRQRCCDK